MAFSSLVFGRISFYTPCTVLTAVSITVVQGGVLVFLLCWERQPSYVVVFLASITWGIVDGMWLTVSAGKLQHLGLLVCGQAVEQMCKENTMMCLQTEWYSVHVLYSSLITVEVYSIMVIYSQLNEQHLLHYWCPFFTLHSATALLDIYRTFWCKFCSRYTTCKHSNYTGISILMLYSVRCAMSAGLKLGSPFLSSPTTCSIYICYHFK